MKLDSNAAWKDAMAAVSANREVLAAIAGVFFLLPSLALGLFVPQPEPPAGVSSEQAMKILGDFYVSALPWFIPMVVLQWIGTLAILVLCTDRTRPTVGEALKQGVGGLLAYFLATVMMFLGFVVPGSLFMGIAAATGIPALAAVVIALLLVAMVYFLLRFSLVAPAIAVERLRSPVAALKRSWALTEGNAGRILLFFIMLFLAFLVITVVISAVVGAIFAVAGGGEVARIGSAVLQAVLGAIFTLMMTAVLAAIHRQLAGPTDGDLGATFD